MMLTSEQLPLLSIETEFMLFLSTFLMGLGKAMVCRWPVWTTSALTRMLNSVFKYKDIFARIRF